MTYFVAFITFSTIATPIIAKLLKRHLDRHYPSADRELEALLADGLELEFSTEAAR